MLEPRRTVEDYSVTELEAFKEAFRPAAEKYRGKMRRDPFIALILVGIGMISLILSKLIDSWVCWSPFLLAMAFLVMFGIPRIPKCPACLNQVGFTLDKFCPECGGLLRNLLFWGTSAECSGCNRSLVVGSGKSQKRNFKIHHCTHCGIPVDDQGL